jgi:hypothetical protein
MCALTPDINVGAIQKVLASATADRVNYGFGNRSLKGG